MKVVKGMFGVIVGLIAFVMISFLAILPFVLGSEVLFM
jgi:Flp pilus assembly pilin Flp